MISRKWEKPGNFGHCGNNNNLIILWELLSTQFQFYFHEIFIPEFFNFLYAIILFNISEVKLSKHLIPLISHFLPHLLPLCSKNLKYFFVVVIISFITPHGKHSPLWFSDNNWPCSIVFCELFCKHREVRIFLNSVVSYSSPCSP